MQYALVGGTRREAEPGLKGTCNFCNSEVIAKCGKQRVWHWAHRGRRVCDNWWEPETEWHRKWKGEFPQEWQEVGARDENGEKHIADVRTERDLVIEFQHSHIDPVEQDAREAFYDNMVWVVDGTRLKRDWPRFEKNTWNFHRWGMNDAFHTSDAKLLFPKTWASRNKPVIFDYMPLQEEGADLPPLRTRLWMLLPSRVGRSRFVLALERQRFIGLVKNGVSFEAIQGKVEESYQAERKRRAELQCRLEREILFTQLTKRRALLRKKRRSPKNWSPGGGRRRPRNPRL